VSRFLDHRQSVEQAGDPTPMFGRPVGCWHAWFAWKPVRTFDRRLSWLRWVKRRCIQKHDYLDGGADFWWQFKR
jgi:hypothetical protein